MLSLCTGMRGIDFFFNGVNYVIRKITSNEKREEKGSQITKERYVIGVWSV